MLAGGTGRRVKNVKYIVSGAEKGSERTAGLHAILTQDAGKFWERNSGGLKERGLAKGSKGEKRGG